MLALGPIAFLNPWLLTGLILLPLAYIIIRAIPPAPRRYFFPATWLTRELDTNAADVKATPWWLILMRLLLLGLIITALAHPVLPPQQQLARTGPAVIVVDNDWATAPDWPSRREALLGLLSQLESQGRQASLATTAAPVDGWPEALELETPATLAEKIRAMAPSPWMPDYETALDLAMPLLAQADASVFYLSSGLNFGGAGDFISKLSAEAPLDIAVDSDAGLRQIAFAAVKPSPKGFAFLLIRGEEAPALTVTLVAKDGGGLVLASQQVEFKTGQVRYDGDFSIPAQLRGRAASLSVEGVRSAAATYVLDARSHRPLVGLIDTPANRGTAPFQSPLFYLGRALSPYATLERGSVDTVLKASPAIIMLPDQGRLPGAQQEVLSRWVDAGGVLVRFAGPNMLADDGHVSDPLLPVRLRTQPRIIGGSLSWSNALGVSDFDESSPFAGIQIAEDVRVERQALARSSSLGSGTVWSKLSDGTPLVSAAPRGTGQLVLFHTTADPQWSNLALSGTFVEMLQRLLYLASSGQALPSGAAEPMLMTQFLTGRGRLSAPPERIANTKYSAPLSKAAGPDNPPGLYENSVGRVAVNLASAAGPISPRTELLSIKAATGSLPVRDVNGILDRSLQPLIYHIIIILVLADILACLWLRGGFQAPKRLAQRLVKAAGAAAGLAAVMSSPDTQAQETPIAQLAANVRLACLETGVAAVDELCLDGVDGLARQLNLRTSVWTGPTQLVRASQENLGLFPILFWPLQPGGLTLSDSEAQRLATYLSAGGMLVIDTGAGVSGQARLDTTLGPPELLASLAQQIALPPLSMLNREHVLSHSFYILSRTPGRRGDGQVWLEAGGEAQGAPVSSIILGNADWFSSWAKVQTSLPGYAGGDGRREELAVRFGINLVMYALTGTYKADQVHLPALLERVGRDE
ncbi:MAG: DUF4159 domain-containing protein [Pseudomonadota bacterium]